MKGVIGARVWQILGSACLDGIHWMQYSYPQTGTHFTLQTEQL